MNQLSEMGASLGIGITTYNRRDLVQRTIDRIKQHTIEPYDLLVADDGSRDGTVGALRERDVVVVTGQNRGVAWNKNRLLFRFLYTHQNRVIILIEDDSYPDIDGWEQSWIQAARVGGHVNLAGPWFADRFISGRGTAELPILSRSISGQCVSFSREALGYVGFFDSRFRGYGYEHADHSRRMVRAGYGGITDPSGAAVYHLIHGGVCVTDPGSHADKSFLVSNGELYEAIDSEQVYRAPWRNDDEREAFRAEQKAAF